jgi:hypothetical protein
MAGERAKSTLGKLNLKRLYPQFTTLLGALVKKMFDNHHVYCRDTCRPTYCITQARS